ncbi:MAG TPA: lmo0937 family membrane protein [Thermoanaerobaculia bacterium]|nr:lmo0937 family membrane protein [Thermoanaerobaculia bacterium]
MNILWVIVAVLAILWLAGFVLDVVGGLIHIILVVAIVVAIVAFIRRKV